MVTSTSTHNDGRGTGRSLESLTLCGYAPRIILHIRHSRLYVDSWLIRSTTVNLWEWFDGETRKVRTWSGGRIQLVRSSAVALENATPSPFPYSRPNNSKLCLLSSSADEAQFWKNLSRLIVCLSVIRMKVGVTINSRELEGLRAQPPPTTSMAQPSDVPDLLRNRTTRL